MKKREFNQCLILLTSNKEGRKFLDINKIPNLSDESRKEMVEFLIRKSYPVVKELIPENFDFSWLRCMGYLYEVINNGFTFICNGDALVKLRRNTL